MTSCQHKGAIHDFTLRQFDKASPEDLTTIHAWWEKHDVPLIGLDCLPSTGLILEDQGVPQGCVFVYRSDSRLAWMEWLTVDPDLGVKQRIRVIHRLIEAVIAWAHKMEYAYMITSVKHGGLIKTLLKHGFIETDTGMKNLIVHLEEG